AKTQYTKVGVLRGKKADWKKAIVRLKDGYKLDLYTTAE
ncbi:MAG: 50S ribosomal protein L23, partial [Calditrichaeota bacterium]|nr:50S ribosomal protein L23 [Calditrichota bacterium]